MRIHIERPEHAHICVWDRVRRQDQTEILLLLYPLIVILPLLPPLLRAIRSILLSLSLSFTHSFSSSFSLVPPRRCFILLAPPCASSTNALLYSSSLLLANGLFVIRLSLSLFGGSVDRFSSLSFCFLFFFLLLLSPILRSFFGYRRFPLYSIILFPLITRQTKIYNCF